MNFTKYLDMTQTDYAVRFTEGSMRWEEYINFASSKLVEKAIYFCENAECEDCPVYINDLGLNMKKK